MAGSGTDSRVRRNALRTFLHAVRTSFLVTIFLWCLGAILFVTARWAPRPSLGFWSRPRRVLPWREPRSCFSVGTVSDSIRA